MTKALVVAAVVLLLSAAAATGVSAQASVDVGIDTDVAGNDATTVGQIESCVAAEVGSTFSIDVFVQNVPESQGGGINGFSYNLLFDPALVEVTGVDNSFLVTSLGEATAFEIIDADGLGGSNQDPLPATTGSLRVDFGDLTANYEEGSGVLSRLELLAKAPGETALRLVDVPNLRASPSIIAGGGASVYPVGTVYNAVAVIGGVCETAGPTPFVLPDGGGTGTIDEADLPAPTTPGNDQATPTPGNGVETRLAIDILPAGNKATEIDAVEGCAAAAVGDLFLVDIVIEDVQELLAWEIALSYDPEVLSVEGRDVAVFQDANSGSSVIDLSAATPDTSGRYVLGSVDSADPATPDSGSGVLAHVTMRAIAEGTSLVTMEKLDLDGDGDFDQGVFLRDIAGQIIGDDEGADTLFDGPTEGAEVRVDGECPDAPEAKVQLVSGDGQTGGTDDDDNGTSLTLIIVVILAAIVVLGGGAAFFVRQRSG